MTNFSALRDAERKEMLVGHYIGVFNQEGWENRFRQDIPLDKLDYLCLAFARIIPIEDGYDLRFTPEDEKKVKQVQQKLKEVNPFASTFITVIADGTYEDHLIDASKDENFPSRVLEFLHKYNLDGIDLDWEVGIEKEPLQMLLVNLYHVLSIAYKCFFMTILPSISNEYDYPLMGLVLDRVQVMCYGSSDWSQLVKDLIIKGIPHSKLVLGIDTEVPFPGVTDDEDSIKAKLQLIRDYKLCGPVSWRIDNDHAENDNKPTYEGVNMIWRLAEEYKQK